MSHHLPSAPARVGLLLLGALSIAAPASAQVTIAHDPVGCLIADSFPVVEARLESGAGIARARVYFRASGEDLWYYVQMESQAEPPLFEGVLPKPLATIEGVEYYLEAFDESFAESRTEEFTVRVVPDPETCEAGMASMSALGSVPVLLVGSPAGAPVIPVGFAGTGVVSVAGAGTGVAGTASAGGGAATAGGISSGLIVGGAAVAGAAVAVAASGGGGDDDGDGAAGTRTPAPTPAPTPEPTPEPTPTPDPGVTGRWVGTTVDDPIPDVCTLDTDLEMDLQQTDGSVSGTYQARVTEVRSAPQELCTEEPGDLTTGPVTGSVSGSTITLRLTFQFPGDLPGEVEAQGTIAGETMGGRFISSDGTPGTWELTRQ